MFKHVCYGFTLLGLFALTAPTEIAAQSSDASELSAEQLEELFAKQKTRGLVLAPTNTQDNTTESVSTQTETAAAPAPAPAETTYVELASDEQINIQISFDFDSSALRTDQKPKLATMCQVMQKVDVDVFRIVGHTDSSGSAGYNERLSLLRAQEVKRFLQDDCNIAPERLEAVGVGEAFPLTKDDPRADANRRVEFQALS